MSEATNAPAVPQQPAITSAVAEAPAAPAGITPTPPEPATVPPEAPDATEQGKAGREAAKYRTQLRTAEGERDTLAGTVDGLQRALIAANVPPRIEFNTDALWKLTEHKPADFFGEDGTLDTAKLTATISETIKTYKIGHHGPEPIPASGTGSGGIEPGKPSWSEAMGNR